MSLTVYVCTDGWHRMTYLAREEKFMVVRCHPPTLDMCDMVFISTWMTQKQREHYDELMASVQKAHEINNRFVNNKELEFEHIRFRECFNYSKLCESLIDRYLEANLKREGWKTKLSRVITYQTCNMCNDDWEEQNKRKLDYDLMKWHPGRDCEEEECK